jgi:flavin-binding protein dodecin
MSVVKVIELIGVSEKSFDEAVNNALKEVKKSIRNITGIKVLGLAGQLMFPMVRFKVKKLMLKLPLPLNVS